MTLADLIVRIREAMSVDASYDAEIIPHGIERAATRLLRDYHFPQAVQKHVYPTVAGSQDYVLPDGFKKELLVYFFDKQEIAWGNPLTKREGFVKPYSDGVPRHYWFWGNNLTTDIVIDAGSAPVTDLILWYESRDWLTNQDWMLNQFDDVLFTYTVFRLAAERQNKELAETFGILWGDERTSLAIYVNELEFDNGEYVQREVAERHQRRYPI